MIIKIYGERCSGTGFLEFLLRKNMKDGDKIVFVSPKINNKSYGWKHGIPKEIDGGLINKKYKDEKVLYICIFRELYSWLNSIFHNPYHMVPFGDFKKFLEQKQKSKVKKRDINDYITGKHFSNDDNGRNIFEIRYLKFIKHLEFYNSQDNIIHLNMEFLQKNPKFLLDVLEVVYGMETVREINTNIKYTKNIKKRKLDELKNAIYNNNTMTYKYVITKKMNKDYENHINNLKISCKLNGKIIK